MHRKRLVPVLVLALALAAPVPALAWGDAPTHFSILYDVVNGDGGLPAAITGNPQAFVQASFLLRT